MACNFVMPMPPGRPKPEEFRKKEKKDKEEIEGNVSLLEKLEKTINEIDTLLCNLLIWIINIIIEN